MNVRWPAFLEGAYLAGGADYPAVSAVFVCFDDDSLGLRTALALHHRLAGHETPVVVRMAESGGLAALLEPESDGRGVFANLHAFGLLDHTCSPEVILGGTHEVLARAIHEEYVRRGEDAGDSLETNPALAPWEELPEDLRQSNFAQADHIGAKLRAVDCALVPLTDWNAAAFRFADAEVERLAQMEHDRFVAERLAAGWRSAPGPKDIHAKTSPTLVPWQELPENERVKDYAAVHDLPAFLARAGFQIVRTAASPADSAPV